MEGDNAIKETGYGTVEMRKLNLETGEARRYRLID